MPRIINLDGSTFEVRWVATSNEGTSQRFVRKNLGRRSVKCYGFACRFFKQSRRQRLIIKHFSKVLAVSRGACPCVKCD